jgi:hypothetical protein
MNKQAYSYSVLRYVHDVTTGEFVNVGLALYCPAMRYANAACRTTSKRLTQLFPSLDSSVFRALMRKVQTRFESLHDEVNGQLALRSYASVMDLAQSVIPQDDSALQWAPMGSGLTSDPDATLDLLFERFVMKHDEASTVHRRNDEQVWKNFSRELEQQQVLKHFQPQTFTTDDDEIKFDRAWKNGVWHCLAPVSFDLASPESIREKAHKWLGQIASVGGGDLKLYFLVGEPSQADLKPVYQSALNILKKASTSTEVFAETDAAALALRLAKQVAQHAASAAHA